MTPAYRIDADVAGSSTLSGGVVFDFNFSAGIVSPQTEAEAELLARLAAAGQVSVSAPDKAAPKPGGKKES
jgi:hypothetical protein